MDFDQYKCLLFRTPLSVVSQINDVTKIGKIVLFVISLFGVFVDTNEFYWKCY